MQFVAGCLTQSRSLSTVIHKAASACGVNPVDVISSAVPAVPASGDLKKPGPTLIELPVASPAVAKRTLTCVSHNMTDEFTYQLARGLLMSLNLQLRDQLESGSLVWGLQI